jgi:hypothetical protein
MGLHSRPPLQQEGFSISSLVFRRYLLNLSHPPVSMLPATKHDASGTTLDEVGDQSRARRDRGQLEQ